MKKQMLATFSKQGGQRCKDIDKAMMLRNMNQRNRSLVNQKRKQDEISRKNLILGKKMNEIFNRKKSNYGDFDLTQSRVNSNDDLEGSMRRGMKINQTSRSNIEVRNNRHLSEQQKQQLLMQISMTSMNEHSNEMNMTSQLQSQKSHSPYHRDNSQGAMNSGAQMTSSKLGVVEKLDGAVKYAVPNKDYMLHHSSAQALDPGGKQPNYYQTAAEGFSNVKGSPRTNVLTQMGHQKRQSELSHHLANAPLAKNKEDQENEDGEEEQDSKSPQRSKNLANLKIRKRQPDYVKRFKFDKQSQRTMDQMSEAQQDQVSHFYIQKTTENAPSLTPVNMIKTANLKGQISVQKTSRESIKQNSLGGLHKIGQPDNFDFVYTQQPFPSMTAKNNQMAQTSLGYSKYHQTMDGSKEPQFMKTQTSFMTSTTSPQKYMEVPRPSILKVLNQMNDSSMKQTFEKMNMYTQNTFKRKHLSLNEAVRKQEAERIQRENHKILLQMNSSKPTQNLATRKLKQDFNKSESLKKQIVLTKYLNRNEITLRKALKQRDEVFNNLPPVQSPLHECKLKQRRSQRRQFQTVHINSDISIDRPGDDSGPTTLQKKKDSGYMIMQHDQSVQKVGRIEKKICSNPGSNMHARNLSVGNSRQALGSNKKLTPDRVVQIYSKKLGNNLLKHQQDLVASRNSSTTGLATDGLHHRAQSGAFDLNNYNFTHPYEEQLRQIFSNNHANHAFQNQYQRVEDAHGKRKASQPASYHRAVETYSRAFSNKNDPTMQDLKRRKYYGNLIGVNNTKIDPQPLQHIQSGQLSQDGGQYGPVVDYLPLIGPPQNQQKMDQPQPEQHVFPMNQAKPNEILEKDEGKKDQKQKGTPIKPLHQAKEGTQKMQQTFQEQQLSKAPEQQPLIKATTQTKGGFTDQAPKQNQRNAAMNNTITTFSSNLVKGTIKSQINTPEIITQSHVNDPHHLNEKLKQDEDSVYDSNYEDDLAQRKNYNVNEKKSSVKKQKQQKRTSENQSKQDENDGSEPYEENWEDEQGNDGADESSKMEDSHAQNSDDYDNDDFYDKEVASKAKNAEEYFQELEDKKSPEDGAQNSNADGGSIFNQTGGRFLNRQPTITSQYKNQQKTQTMMRTTMGGASDKRSNKGAGETATNYFFNAKTESDKQQDIVKIDPASSKGFQELNSATLGKIQKQTDLKATMGSALSSANKPRESSSRYDHYEETQEMLVASKEKMAGSNVSSPANELTDHSPIRFGKSHKGSKLSNYDESGQKRTSVPKRSNLQAIEEYKTSAVQDTSTSPGADKTKQPAQKIMTFALNEESEDSSDNYDDEGNSTGQRKPSSKIQRKPYNEVEKEESNYESENFDDEEVHERKPKSTYSEDNYSEADDQSEAYTEMNSSSVAAGTLAGKTPQGAPVRDQPSSNLEAAEEKEADADDDDDGDGDADGDDDAEDDKDEGDSKELEGESKPNAEGLEADKQFNMHLQQESRHSSQWKSVAKGSSGSDYGDEEDFEKTSDYREEDQKEDQEQDEYIKTFTVGGGAMFDLDEGMEGGNENFFYQRNFDGLDGSEINGSHIELEGNRECYPLTFSTDGQDLVGRTFQTTTPAGNTVTWKCLNVGGPGEGDYRITIGILKIEQF